MIVGKHAFMSVGEDLRFKVIVGLHGFLRMRGVVLPVVVIGIALQEINPVLDFRPDGSFITPVSLRDSLVCFLKDRGLKAIPDPSLN